jgi:23S rRNA pseudouridine1911/1915/1917 synthase
MLHAWKLKIPHPISGELMEFEAPLPEDFSDLLENMNAAPC